MANLDMVKRVMSAIEAEPRRWSQSWWAEFPEEDDEAATPECDTVMCFAGWTVFLNDPEFYKSLWVWDDVLLAWRWSQLGMNMSFRRMAGQILELEPQQEQDLFMYDPGDDVESMKLWLNAVFGEEIYPWPDEDTRLAVMANHHG